MEETETHQTNRAYRLKKEWYEFEHNQEIVHSTYYLYKCDCGTEWYVTDRQVSSRLKVLCSFCGEVLNK